MQLYVIKQPMKQLGMILPMIMIVMQVLFLFILYTLTSTVIGFKMSQQILQKEQFSRELEHVFQTIEGQLQIQLPACLMKPTNWEVLSSQPESWWKTQTCTGNFHTIQYYYVLEVLGEDLCAHIKNAEGQIADYYRVSLVGFDNRKGFKTFVQSTQVIPVVELKKCMNHSHVVTIGRQAWNVIY